MKDIVLALIIIAIVGIASYYLYTQRKVGVKCIGCPSCSGGKCCCKK